MKSQDNNEPVLQEGLVSDAFSRQSVIFDELYTNNAIAAWMRDRARAEVMQHIQPGACMLELNCGTGMDTVWFAERGIKVVAIDNAPGMLHHLQQKLLTHPELDVTPILCSFNQLDQLGNQQFDYIFSNFGGLNCTDTLDDVLKQAATMLKPGGHLTLVIMPKICPWELAMVFKGYFKTAFRRFRRHTDAHLEGVHFSCYYYAPSFVKKSLGATFDLLTQKGMAFLMPPPFIDQFKEKHPRSFRWLQKAELALENYFPFKSCCDHYLISFRKKPLLCAKDL